MGNSAATLRTDQTDEQLLGAFARGSDVALGELAERYEGALIALARGIIGRDDLANDAVQDAWLRVIRGAKHFDGRSTFKTWVYRIVINRCLDVRAAAARAAQSGANGYHQTSDTRTSDDVATRERLDQLRDAMRALEPGQRVILMLCYQDRVGHESAAQILNIPVGTLKSRLHGTLEVLRAAIARPHVANPHANEAKP